MCDSHDMSRRTFIRDMGRGVVAFAVGGLVLAACGSEVEPAAATGEPESPGPTSTPAAPTTAAPSETVTGAAGLTVQRANLGFVSAYGLIRGTEAALVDTGVSGSAAAIERALAEVGVGWGAVGYVVLTHRHPDHIGSLGAVAGAAAEAVLFAGGADLDAMSASRPIQAVRDGDEIFGFQVVDTPGHTPGHIAVFDPAASVLVAGDALNGQGSGVAGIVDGVGGPNPQFTPDMDSAIESARKLAGLAPDSIYFGHGEPKVGGAAAALEALAASL